VPGDEPEAPVAYPVFTAIGSFFFKALESDDVFGGEIGPYRGCTLGSVCDQDPESFGSNPVSNATLELDRVSFLATELATNDRGDIRILDVGFNDEFRDANGDIIDHADITFGTASIVPEPTDGVLAACALVTLAALARSRSRSVAQ
jgi:hypothetical protein